MYYCYGEGVEKNVLCREIALSWTFIKVQLNHKGHIMSGHG